MKAGDSNEILWLDLQKGNNNLHFEWLCYIHNTEDKQLISQDSVSIEYIPYASHICKDCGYMEDHDYSADCDDTCNTCGQQRTAPQPHSYSSDCDTVCNECGYQRELQAEHQFGTDGKSDKCSNCGILNIAGMKFDTDKLKLTYTGKVQCPEVILKDSAGNIISSDTYSVEIVSESAVSTGEGYTFTVSGNGVDAVGKQTGTWSISYLSTDAGAVAEGTKKADSEWYTSDVKIKAPAGYLIADGNGADAGWTEYLTQKDSTDPVVVSEDGSTDITYYLKNIATGGITDARTVLVKKDAAAPELEVVKATGAAAGFAENDDSVRITFFADDALSGMDNMKYSLDGADEALAASGDSVIVRTPGSHVLAVTAMDKAGNVSTKRLHLRLKRRAMISQQKVTNRWKAANLQKVIIRHNRIPLLSWQEM